MTARVDQIVTAAVVESLENMAFMEVLAATDESSSFMAEETVAVKQLVVAPVQGEFYLRMARPLLAMIAATIYTMATEEVSEQQLEDVATELLNTIAGKFLNDFLPADETYKLGLPVIEPAEAVDPDQPLRKWFFQMAESSFTLAVSADLLAGGSMADDDQEQQII